MHKLTNKFRKLFLAAATISTAGLLAGCGVSASGVESDNSGVTESQSEANDSEQNYFACGSGFSAAVRLHRAAGSRP